MTSPQERKADGALLTALWNAVVQIVRKYTGRGPARPGNMTLAVHAPATCRRRRRSANRAPQQTTTKPPGYPR
jgi:hypothetical protein